MNHKWTGWDIFLIAAAICLLWFVFHNGISFDKLTSGAAKIADKVHLK